MNETAELKNTIVANDADTRGTRTSDNKRRSRVPLITAILISPIFALGFLEFSNQLVSRTLVSLFGPPKVILAESFSEKPDGPTFDHSAFDALLKQYVDADGWVDYSKLKSQQDKLDAYIKTIGDANIQGFGRNERLAFLINSYNAFTLKLIVENYPLKSIKEIPTADRWDGVRWNLAGQTVSLNQIEHEHVRPNFKEPRIHFALVCAAIGCPPLRNEAFTGARVEEQLESQANYVHQNRTWFGYDSGSKRLQLTQLYNWYGGDFVQVAGSVEQYAANYSAALKTDLEQGTTPVVSWLDYDWTLNDKPNRAAR